MFHSKKKPAGDRLVQLTAGLIGALSVALLPVPAQARQVLLVANTNGTSTHPGTTACQLKQGEIIRHWTAWNWRANHRKTRLLQRTIRPS